MFRFFLLVFAFFFSFSAHAVKISYVSGDREAILAETEFDLAYDNREMKVGAFRTEEEFIRYERVRLSQQQSMQRADEWEKGWRANFETTYRPKFETLINKRENIHVEEGNQNARYRLILKTTFIEPGFNVGIAKKPAYISVQFIFVERENPSKEIARFQATRVPGSDGVGFDFAVGQRVGEAYGKTGKMMAAYFGKKKK